jgi:hypothetical protein
VEPVPLRIPLYERVRLRFEETFVRTILRPYTIVIGGKGRFVAYFFYGATAGL